MYKFAAEIQIRSQGSRLLTLSAPHINHNPAKMIKKILPDLIAILAFVLISFAYFFPADIEGRILFQHDLRRAAVQFLFICLEVLHRFSTLLLGNLSTYKDSRIFRRMQYHYVYHDSSQLSRKLKYIFTKGRKCHIL